MTLHYFLNNLLPAVAIAIPTLVFVILLTVIVLRDKK